MSSTLPSLRMMSIRDSAVDALRSALLEGKFQPGESLSEPALASQMGISRGPVREALLVLEQEGLVVHNQNRGFSVLTLGPEDRRAMTKVRVPLEALALELARAKATAEDLAEMEADLERMVATYGQPVVAVIHGICIGGGLALAASADVRLAADDARFAVPPGRLGLGYHRHGVERFLQLVGPAATAELFFTARQIHAAEALQFGLVNRVVAKGDLDATAEAFVATIAANAPLTLRAAKAAMVDAMRPAAAQDPAHVEALIAACYESRDYQEGVAAFLEKRKPAFRGE